MPDMPHVRTALVTTLLERLRASDGLDPEATFESTRPAARTSRLSLVVTLGTENVSEEHSTMGMGGGTERRVLEVMVIVTVKPDDQARCHTALDEACSRIERTIGASCGAVPDLALDVVHVQYDATEFDYSDAAETGVAQAKLQFSVLYGVAPGQPHLPRS